MGASDSMPDFEGFYKRMSTQIDKNIKNVRSLNSVSKTRKDKFDKKSDMLSQNLEKGMKLANELNDVKIAISKEQREKRISEREKSTSHVLNQTKRSRKRGRKRSKRRKRRRSKSKRRRR